MPADFALGPLDTVLWKTQGIRRYSGYPEFEVEESGEG